MSAPRFMYFYIAENKPGYRYHENWQRI